MSLHEEKISLCTMYKCLHLHWFVPKMTFCSSRTILTEFHSTIISAVYIYISLKTDNAVCHLKIQIGGEKDIVNLCNCSFCFSTRAVLKQHLQKTCKELAPVSGSQDKVT